MTQLNLEAYPLCWPDGWNRTTWRKRSSFKVPTFAQGRDTLLREVKLLGASDVVLSTNIELRLDGLPYAQRAEPMDPGVAIFFKYTDKPMCFACDRWDRVRDNVRSVQLTIAAIRGIERWGASDMMERAFTGFLRLPAPGNDRNWRAVLGFANTDRPTIVEMEYEFRKLARVHHPDRGGDQDRFAQLQRARAQAREALGWTGSTV